MINLGSKEEMKVLEDDLGDENFSKIRREVDN